MDTDPAIFIIDLQDASKKLIFNTIFSAYYFLKVNLHHFSKIKSQKESQNRRNQGFSYYFCVMIEGSGSGSILLTSGSGSGRPKKMWIRIRNTGLRICNLLIMKICLFEITESAQEIADLRFADLKERFACLPQLIALTLYYYAL